MVGWILFLSLLFSFILGDKYPDTEEQLKTICDFMKHVSGNDSLNCMDPDCLMVNTTLRDCYVSLAHYPDLGFNVSNWQPHVNISTLWENMSFVTMLSFDGVAYGSIPDFIFTNFINLTDIHFIGSADYLTNVYGTIPDLSHLTKLTALDFERTPNLSGTIPTSIGLLTELNLFYCVNCSSLSGTIPTEILLLNQMQRVVLQDCNLTGTIPNVGNSLPLLEVLYLQDNQLTGTIPNFTNQPNLRLINVGSNDLTGTIPYISNTTILAEFNVSDNHLVGVIPTPLSTCVKKYDISGNDGISGNFTCDNPGYTVNVSGAEICNCPGFLNLSSPCPDPSNCAVPCNSSTTVGCIGNTQIIYGDTNITDIISPGDYIIGGNLNLNNTIIISNSTIIISNDLNLLPGATLELNNSTIIINGNLILGDNSNTIINANQPITVNKCAYLQGSIQSTVPDSLANSTSGSFVLIYTNCTNGDFNSTVILPNPDSSVSGCFHAQVVKNSFSLDVNYDYTCESTLPLPLILGLCIGIPGFFIVVAIIFTVVTPLRNLIRPYSKKNKSVEEVDDGEEEEDEDIAEA